MLFSKMFFAKTAGESSNIWTVMSMSRSLSWIVVSAVVVIDPVRCQNSIAKMNAFLHD